MNPSATPTPNATNKAAPTGCPYHGSQAKTASEAAQAERSIERDSEGVWHIRNFDAARAVLRSSQVQQAGFSAETVTGQLTMISPPMLYLEGPEHHAMRKQTARFFTPKAVQAYDGMIEAFVDSMMHELHEKGQLDLSDLSMKLAVRVAAEVVGLTNSDMDAMANRLNRFFGMDIIDPDAPWTVDKIRRMLIGQANTLNFHLRDVWPAIRARRKQRGEDLISHLLDKDATTMEILVECITFGAAGMVTTREFIAVAAWHFFQNEQLKADYLAADRDTRFDILHEILRLEPVVGNLVRRTVEPLTIESDGETVTIPAGDLVNVSIYAANDDGAALGPHTEVVCPQRDLPRGVNGYGMSFGDGAHRCPGAYIAIEETDIFLTRFLKVETLRMVQEPTVTYSDLVKGYELRNFIVAVD